MSSSNNNTIIICDTPSPVKDHAWSKSVTNYRKRLRSSDSSRALIDTPYESPLNHFRRNLRPIDESAEDIVDVTAGSGPPVKKRKVRSIESRQLFNPDESVIIVADQRSCWPAERRSKGSASDNDEDDVVEIPEERLTPDLPNSSGTKLSKVKTGKKGKSTPKLGRKVKKERQQVEEATKGEEAHRKSPRNPKSLKHAKSPKCGARETVQSAKRVNDENHNGQIMGSKKNASSAPDVEEIEVVWSSRPKAEETASAPVASPVRAKASSRRPIVVDVMPSLANERFNDFEDNPRSEIISKQHSSSQKGRTRDNKKKREKQTRGRLREIVVDGSNVAMGHSRNKTFSEKGLQIVIDYFKCRGHTVKVFLPQSSRARGRHLIEKLHDEGTVIFTPSRKIAGRKITPYDDRFILDYATKCDGIVVSSDQYRDLWAEKPEWRNTIENRLLAPTFVGDYLMFPEDPLGRSGPELDEFLRF